MRRKNFLKLTNKRKDQVIVYGIKRGWKWGTLYKYYKQPTWCSYKGALHGELGCWSLMGWGMETKKDLYIRKCNSCELSNYYINNGILN